MDIKDGNLEYAFGVSQLLVKVLTQAGDDVSRENIMKQAANLHDVQLGVIDPNIRVNTSPTDFRPYSQFRLARFNGEFFEPFSDVMSVD
jgi:branched-chain amino acid transport system substrate-binding protein